MEYYEFIFAALALFLVLMFVAARIALFVLTWRTIREVQKDTTGRSGRWLL